MCPAWRMALIASALLLSQASQSRGDGTGERRTVGEESSQCQVATGQRMRCGEDSSDEQQCHVIGCCWDGSRSETPCYAPEGAIRLVDGVSAASGRVEIFYHGQWGTICDDGWDYYSAEVACRQLGFYGGWPVPQAYFGPGEADAPVWLDEVECQGAERALYQCEHWPVGERDCDHSEDAGVICEPDSGMILSEGNLRLVGGTAYNVGRVEILHAGRWGGVCAELGWGHNEAAVVCNQIGGFRGGMVLNNILLPEASDNEAVWMTGVLCTGLETRLDVCDRNAWGGTCYPGEEAIVQCHEWIDEPGSIDDVRLVGSGWSWKGRLEVSVAGEWGTVCDDGFTHEAAMVVCQMLGLSGGRSLGNGIFEPGHGQIWLDDVACAGEERTLDECDHRRWGENDCTHEEDVAVYCTALFDTIDI